MAKILIVDDEFEIRDLIGSIVAQSGHDVLEAKDAAAAWVHLDAQPDAIFLDIDMPGETGIEFLLRMRTHPLSKKIPVVFVTAYRERATPLLSMNIGIVDIVDKPFHMQTITTQLKNMLAKGNTQDCPC